MKSHLINLIQKNGPIHLDKMIDEALFNPYLGYYKCQNPFGKEGDFITSPEISQIFGELIGAYFINIWQNSYNSCEINLVEMGAGKGTLMADFLNCAKKNSIFLKKIKISIIENSPKLKAIQKINLQNFEIIWYENFYDFYKQNEKRPIFFIANELFDCFAVRQFIKTNSGWAEKIVAATNENLQFIFQEKIEQNLLKEISSNLGIDLTKNNFGDIVEYSKESLIFMKQLSKAINKNGGIGLIIDYGYIENKFVNTLQAIKNHQFCNLLQEIGNCDITSLVNFDALYKIALNNNLETSLITQREFLISLGINFRKEKLKLNKSKEEQDLIESQTTRLIDHKQMGQLFKVLIIWQKMA